MAQGLARQGSSQAGLVFRLAAVSKSDEAECDIPSLLLPAALSLVQRIENARHLLRSGRLANESSVSTSIVFPILQALGWDVFDPTTVAPEYKVENRRVDFALLLHGRPAVFVEVKQPGRGVGADRQLFEYAFHEGVPLAVLTDGATWHLYLPAMQGSYDERRVYLLDLLERDPSESAERLVRYLDYAAVVSGDAFERAQLDYKRSRQRREAREAIPAAWESLLSEGDTQLVNALAAEVERRSGYQPEPEDVLSFLRGRILPKEVSAKPSPSPLPRPKNPTLPGPFPSLPVNPPDHLPSVGFALRGGFTPARNGTDALTGLLRAISEQDPGFLDRFVALPKHGRTRRYIAKAKSDLNPGRSDLAELSVEVRPGYWLTTNTSSNRKRVIAEMACKVAGLRFGSDVQARFA